MEQIQRNEAQETMEAEHIAVYCALTESRNMIYLKVIWTVFHSRGLNVD